MLDAIAILGGDLVVVEAVDVGALPDTVREVAECDPLAAGSQYDRDRFGQRTTHSQHYRGRGVAHRIGGIEQVLTEHTVRAAVSPLTEREQLGVGDEGRGEVRCCAHGSPLVSI